VAILCLTYKCQAKCIHCSAGLYKNISPELNLSQWKKVIEQIDKLGTPRIHITGGEPSLKDNFLKITKYAASKGIITFLETNGFNLKEETIKALKQSKIASLDVSIDSTNPQTHDQLRNLKNSFKKAIETINTGKKLKIPVMLSTYATRENIVSGEIFDLINLAKKLKSDAVRIMPPQPSGRWLNKFEILLSENDRRLLRKNFPLYTILDRTELPICPIKSKYTFFIAPDGETLPCPHLPFSFGNIKENSLENILENMAKNQMFANKSICYITQEGFRDNFIKPIKNETLPLKV
jgi:MoaA/NifB/PqqE/SkfB family radical SAM enzyme